VACVFRNVVIQEKKLFPFGTDPKEQVVIRFRTSQLGIILEVLAKDPTYDESEHMLIGMFEDAIQDAVTSEEETEYGFCY
jgi:hypothetical protein